MVAREKKGEKASVALEDGPDLPGVDGWALSSEV
jgi:hypothetical protein